MLLYLSGYFDETRDDYYRLLLNVSLRGDWREWLEYFLRGVRQQAKAALADTQNILRFYENCREKLKQAKRAPQAAALILDELFGNPVFSISRYSSRTGAPFINVSKGVEFWIGQGLLQEATGQKRNRWFLAPDLLRIMEPKSPPAAPPGRDLTIAEPAGKILPEPTDHGEAGQVEH